MKILHISDLHLGKSISTYSLIKEQEYALGQIIKTIKEKEVELLIIAGDIFDTSIPNWQALKLYSNFLEELIFNIGIKVIAISGNHDSSKRLDINGKFFNSNNYYLISEYSHDPIVLEDDFGKINFYPIPFISINKANTIFDRDFKDYTDLYAYLLEDIKYDDRNVLITHCYAADRNFLDEEVEYNPDQKPLNIGGSDLMDASLFEKFDYVALGHLHRAHFVKNEKIRYSGTFMKYSFDEVNEKKSISLVSLEDKLEIEKIYIKELRGFKILEGKFKDILEEDPSDDYIKFILKDETLIENAMAKLKQKFKNAVSITYANKGVFESEETFTLDLENKNSLDLFKEFYKFKMDEDLKDEQIDILKRVINETD